MVPIRESGTRRATEYLIHANIGELSPVLIYHHINAGFTLLDVQQMLLEITPRSCGPTLRRILGKPTSAKLHAGRLPVRLNSQQSAVAYMYAKIFELSLNIFGTRELAEQWMSDGQFPAPRTRAFHRCKSVCNRAGHRHRFCTFHFIHGGD